MMIGQKLGTVKWQLRDKLLSETKSYKYLGVIISRMHKDNNHINSHPREKAKKSESYIRYTLANNLDIKHATLGDTLWQKITLSALSHGGGVCFNNTNTSNSHCNHINISVPKLF